MKLLDQFNKSEASYDDLALALLDMDENGVDEVLNLLFMHSGLGRLTFYEMLIQNVIRDYDHLEDWRDEAGEIT